MRREGLSYQRMAQLDANAQSHNRVATDEEAAVVVDVGRDAASVVAAGSVASRKAEQSEGGRAAPSNAESTSSTLGNQPHHLAQPNLGPSQLLRLAATVFCCLAWTMASSAAILVNKHILVNLAFPYPVTVSWLGLLTTTVASFLALRLFLKPSDRRGIRMSYYFARIMPCGFFMAVAFLTGNISFLFLTLAFVQMLKAFTPVVTMLLLFAFGLDRPTVSLVGSVCVISAGVAVASYGELNMSVVGLASMLTSVVAEAVRLVLMQYLLSDTSQSFHPLEGLFYISSSCTLWLLMQALAWEWGPIMKAGAYQTALDYPAPFLVAAFAGFSVNTLAILVIKLSSSLTLKVLGTVKDAALVVVSVALYHERVGALQMYGYSLSLMGFLAYNVAKARGAGAPGPPQATGPPGKLA